MPTSFKSGAGGIVRESVGVVKTVREVGAVHLWGASAAGMAVCSGAGSAVGATSGAGSSWAAGIGGVNVTVRLSESDPSPSSVSTTLDKLSDNLEDCEVSNQKGYVPGGGEGVANHHSQTREGGRGILSMQKYRLSIEGSGEGK